MLQKGGKEPPTKPKGRPKKDASESVSQNESSTEDGYVTDDEDDVISVSENVEPSGHHHESDGMEIDNIDICQTDVDS